MTEYHAGWQLSLKLLVWVAFITLYWLGGRSYRWLRWLVGGLVFAGGIIGVSMLFYTFHWWYLGSLLAYPASLSNGYSGDTLTVKLRRRALYGLLLGASNVFFVSTATMWLVMLVQTTLAVLSSVLFGIWNPFENAPDEEAAIAACSMVLVPMMG